MRTIKRLREETKRLDDKTLTILDNVVEQEIRERQRKEKRKGEVNIFAVVGICYLVLMLIVLLVIF